MASYNDYKNVKNKNADCLVLLKSGVFYETYDQDCKIMLDLFDYQIKNFKNFNRTGFPVSNIEKVKEKLNEKNVNYIIIDCGKINKITFENNRYNFYINKRVDKKIYNQKYQVNFHEELQIINEYKLTLNYIEKTVKSFPKSERVLKDKISESLYDILELIYTCNCSKERNSYQARIIAKLKMLDFYLSKSLEHGYINSDKYIKCGTFLIKIVNLTEAWMISSYEKSI